jgi:hypothetical protein
MDDIRYFGTFDANGFPVGFFPSDVWPTPPDDAVEITEAQWQEFMQNQGQRRWDGSDVVPGVQEPSLNQRITSAPDALFGGPTIAQVLGEP